MMDFFQDYGAYILEAILAIIFVLKNKNKISLKNVFQNKNSLKTVMMSLPFIMVPKTNKNVVMVTKQSQNSFSILNRYYSKKTSVFEMRERVMRDKLETLANELNLAIIEKGDLLTHQELKAGLDNILLLLNDRFNNLYKELLASSVPNQDFIKHKEDFHFHMKNLIMVYKSLFDELDEHKKFSPKCFDGLALGISNLHEEMLTYVTRLKDELKELNINLWEKLYTAISAIAPPGEHNIQNFETWVTSFTPLITSLLEKNQTELQKILRNQENLQTEFLGHFSMLGENIINLRVAMQKSNIENITFFSNKVLEHTENNFGRLSVELKESITKLLENAKNTSNLSQSNIPTSPLPAAIHYIQGAYQQQKQSTQKRISTFKTEVDTDLKEQQKFANSLNVLINDSHATIQDIGQAANKIADLTKNLKHPCLPKHIICKDMLLNEYFTAVSENILPNNIKHFNNYVKKFTNYYISAENKQFFESYLKMSHNDRVGKEGITLRRKIRRSILNNKINPENALGLILNPQEKTTTPQTEKVKKQKPKAQKLQPQVIEQVQNPPDKVISSHQVHKIPGPSPQNKVIPPNPQPQTETEDLSYIAYSPMDKQIMIQHGRDPNSIIIQPKVEQKETPALETIKEPVNKVLPYTLTNDRYIAAQFASKVISPEQLIALQIAMYHYHGKTNVSFNALILLCANQSNNIKQIKKVCQDIIMQLPQDITQIGSSYFSVLNALLLKEPRKAPDKKNYFYNLKTRLFAIYLFIEANVITLEEDFLLFFLLSFVLVDEEKKTSFSQQIAYKDFDSTLKEKDKLLLLICQKFYEISENPNSAESLFSEILSLHSSLVHCYQRSANETEEEFIT